MATQEQYDFFKYLFELEEQRYSQLQAKAQIYLAIITAYVVALAFNGTDIAALTTRLHVPAFVLLGVGVLVTASLAFTVAAVGIRNYERVTDPDDIITSLADVPPTNEKFFDQRIVDFSVASNTNADLNNRTARLLGVAVLLLAAATGLHLFALTFGLYKEITGA